MATGGTLLSVDFEISGRVQGVFFRRDTWRTAKRLQLVGWVRNTPHNTVQGHIQGQEDKVTQMKHWLRNTGSKASRIVKADFTGEKKIDKLSFEEFTVRK